MRATSLCTLVQMVASGEGVTLLPTIAREVEARGNEVRLLAFSNPAPARTIGLAWRPGSPAADDFRAFGDALKTVPRAGLDR